MNSIFGFLIGQPLSFIFGIHKLLKLSAKLSTKAEWIVEDVEKALEDKISEIYKEFSEEELEGKEKKQRLQEITEEIDLMVSNKAKDLLLNSDEALAFYKSIMLSKFLFFVGGLLVSSILFIIFILQ
jgi:hypothetical protein